MMLLRGSFLCVSFFIDSKKGTALTMPRELQAGLSNQVIDYVRFF
jgi:hypothetical protein